jgi:uncharacterized protein YgfB (UPF0149 family)
MDETTQEAPESVSLAGDDAVSGAADVAAPDRIARAGLGLRTAVERLLAEARHGDFVEAADLVRHATHLLQTLDPQALEPRGGLAGLFDGRGPRLKRFRAAYLSAAASAGDTAAALAERGRSASRRAATLDTLHAEAARAIAEVDAALAEGEAQLRDLATAAEDIPDSAPPADTATTDPQDETPAGDASDEALPGPEAVRSETLDAESTLAASGHESTEDVAETGRERLSARLAALRAARAAGIAQLPLARAVQNAEHAAPAQLGAAAGALSTWVEDWRHGLGLAGRKPRKIRPDGVALARTRDAALAALAETEARLTAMRSRAGETEGRMSRVVEQVRRAA